jgi:uncharacterized protein (TIGR00369 family)
MTSSVPEIDVARLVSRLEASQDQRFGSFGLSRLFGMDITRSEESCLVSFEVVPEMANPVGSLHGGVMATALDISMGHLLFYSTGQPAQTLEMKVQYIAPARCGSRVVCASRILRIGKSVAFVQATATATDDTTLLAFATATWRVAERRNAEATT